MLCNRLREWKTASEIIEQLDSSLSSISVGTLNHLLNFLGTVQVIVCLKKQYSDDCFCICTELRNAYSSNLFTQILENIYETRSKSFTWDWAKRRPAPFPVKRRALGRRRGGPGTRLRRRGTRRRRRRGAQWRGRGRRGRGSARAGAGRRRGGAGGRARAGAAGDASAARPARCAGPGRSTTTCGGARGRGTAGDGGGGERRSEFCEVWERRDLWGECSVSAG